VLRDEVTPIVLIFKDRWRTSTLFQIHTGAENYWSGYGLEIVLAQAWV
jgi:hypothetical protein